MYLFVVNQVGIILDARLAKIRGWSLFNGDYIIYLLNEFILTPEAVAYEYIGSDRTSEECIRLALI